MTALAAPLRWPPQCCVPAFVQSALRELGVACPTGPALARILGVRVERDQANPFDLPLATRSDPAGVRAADAEKDINLLCWRLGAPVHFRHVPFLTIACEAWEEVLREADDAGAIVGVGVDYRRLSGTGSNRPALHVLRILGAGGGALSVRDDSGESTPDTFEVDRERLLSSVLAVPDGFWIMGAERCMTLRFALPWRAPA